MLGLSVFTFTASVVVVGAIFFIRFYFLFFFVLKKIYLSLLVFFDFFLAVPARLLRPVARRHLAAR